jgi:3-methyladenine DNA glycosylase AlkD
MIRYLPHMLSTVSQSRLIRRRIYSRSARYRRSDRCREQRIIGADMLDVVAAAATIENRCRDAGTPARAAGERAYLKSDLEHFGAGVPEIRRVVRDFVSSHTDLTHDELVAVVDELWSKSVHECRMAAVMLLDLEARLLGPADLDLVESMIRGSRTWAYVDDLAGHMAGSLLLRYPELAPRIDAWAVDDNFWIRRSALLAQLLPLKQGAAFETFGRYADAMLEEKEFFIRKAIGWVLRETSKRRQQEVFAWILPRAARASGVTLREAVKYLEPAQRDAVMQAAGKQRA